MPVEFLGIAGTNPASEVTPRTGGPLDLEYTAKLARAHEDNGWDRILFAYHSGSPDPAQVAAYVAGRTERINLVVAHRPNVAYPTLTAKTFATLDHISGGRFEVHVITGGSTADQAAEGDFLAKDDRYGRTREFIQILKQAWTSDERFDFDGEHYRFEQFRRRHQAAAAAAAADLVRWLVRGGVRGRCGRGGHLRAVGRAAGRDPEQLATIDAAAAAAGRADRPTIQIAFRPILAPTEELAWEKAERILGRIKDVQAGGVPPPAPLEDPRERGLAAAAQGGRGRRAARPRALDRADRADRRRRQLDRLVGTPDTVAAALLDYYDLGIRIFSARGYDIYDDAIDFGRYVIPLVRSEVAHREDAKGPGLMTVVTDLEQDWQTWHAARERGPGHRLRLAVRRRLRLAARGACGDRTDCPASGGPTRSRRT